jgi:hypothetical protein
MTRRTALVVAGAILAAAVGSTVLAVVLSDLNGEVSFGFVAMSLSAGVLFAGVGAVIVARRPENLVGWILSSIGLIWTIGQLAEHYSKYAYVTRPGSLPGAIVAAWYGAWFWIDWLFFTFVFLLFLFPSGRLPSARWRPVFSLTVLSAVVLTVLAALQRQLDLPNIRFAVRNPIGILPYDDVESGFLGSLLIVLLLSSAAAALSSVVVRFRRSSGDERQQLKWFTYAGTFLVVGFVLLGFLDGILGRRLPFVDAALFALVPTSISVAVLRHRLYDIDIVINRTLVYGALTAVLAGVYVAGVVGLGSALRSITDQERNNLAVAASTLAVAALFRPARGRIQGFIDRRFYRAKYDAARTLEAFSGRLRDEVELDSLTSDLLGVVNETLQPAHASLWLRPGDGTRASSTPPIP